MTRLLAGLLATTFLVACGGEGGSSAPATASTDAGSSGSVTSPDTAPASTGSGSSDSVATPDSETTSADTDNSDSTTTPDTETTSTDTGSSGSVPPTDPAPTSTDSENSDSVPPTEPETTPTEPDSSDEEVTNSAPTISGTPSTASEDKAFTFTPTTSDPDGDTLAYTVAGKPSWAAFDTSTGTLSGTPSYADIMNAPETSITVSDGALVASMAFTVNITQDALEKAVRTGDASGLASKTLVLDALTYNFEANQTKFNTARAKLFGLSATGALTADSLTNISWDPTHDAARLKASFGFNEAILISNDVTNTSYDVRNTPLGIVGHTDTARYMVLGSNPMRNAYRGGEVSDDMHQFMQNSMEWLTSRNDLTTKPFNVVIAQSGQNYYFPDQQANRDWLDTNYPDSISYNEAEICDGAALDACLSTDTDLLVVSQELGDGENATQIAASVKAAMARGIDVLYMHLDGNNGELAQTLLPVFNVTYDGDNYWSRQKITSMDVQAGFGQLPNDVTAIKTLITNLETDNFTINLTDCDNNNCPEASNYNEEFLLTANILRARMADFDEAGIRIFDEDSYRYEKLLVLLGDMYRRDVVYPMDKIATPRSQFLTSLLADNIIYNSRDYAPAQADMGNFSRSDFSHITPERKSVSLIAKPSFRSTGAYALPGQSFTVTRTDNSDVETDIFINSLRNGATHLFDENAYNRPKYLTTSHMPLVAGQSQTFTSVYGGPIQIKFSSKDVPVELTFDNVGSHPYWTGPDDDIAFEQAVAAADYDWSELVTAAFEVHSKTDKMQKSLDDAKYGGSAVVMANAAERYMSNLPHVLAGFKGAGIDEVPEIVDFAEANNIEMQTLDQVKHMNADQATCGYGCSGNPYDAYWNYDPLGHGDIHELGHGLEKDRFLFTGWDGHANTNPYSYYSKTTYGADTGADLDTIDCQNLNFEEIFARVQASQNEADPFAYMQANNTGDWNDSVSMMVQMYMAAQAEGVLDNGWHLLARTHVIERAFNTADNNDDTWLAERAGLGFDGYSRAEAQAISNDDFMLITLSYASGRDMTDFITTWGLGSSDRAKAHVAAMGLPSMPVQFFLANDDDFCLGLDKTAVPIDGAQVWPF